MLAVSRKNPRVAAGVLRRVHSGCPAGAAIAAAVSADGVGMEVRAGRKAAASWSPCCRRRELSAYMKADLLQAVHI